MNAAIEERAGVYRPSPITIAKECERIRAGWSRQERALRWCGPSAVQWSLPECVLGSAAEYESVDYS